MSTFDFCFITGMTILACNPKLGYGVTQVMSNHYPERLGLVICVNHGPIFHGIWKAMKIFIHPNTVAKVKLIKSKSKVKQTFQDIFPPELSNWLLEEMKLNKTHPLISTQKEFWNKPKDSMAHDPRGCPSYVDKYINTIGKSESCEKTHKPHPNIISSVLEEVKHVTSSPVELLPNQPLSYLDSSNSDSDEEFALIEMFDIPDEFKVPDDAIKFT